MSLNLNIQKFKNLTELIDYCIKYYNNNKERFQDKSISEIRRNLSIFIEKFHMESGTLNSEIKEKIAVLREGNSILLMTAHQPNLFPYSGILRKATLNYVLGKELEKRLGVQVINFYGIADQDFTDDRWVKSSLLPAITRKEGILNLNIKLPNKIILKNIPKPSIKIIYKWKDEINIWLKEAINSINNYCNEIGISNWYSKKLLLYNNFINFWEIVEQAYEQATTYSDFNAFIISKTVNEVWEYDTLFSRFSECQSIFFHEFNLLLSHFDDYSSSINEAIKFLPKDVRSLGVSEKEAKLLPFWYYCDCGSKARLFFHNHNDSIIGNGHCINCRKEYNIYMGKVDKIDVSKIASKISARAIPMILVFSMGLGLSCYVGGMGGIEYLKEARYVANKLDITLPPFVIWRPRDKYLGVGQLEALLEYKRITGHYDVNKLEEEMNYLKSIIDDFYRKINILETEKNEVVNKLRKKEINIKIFKTDLKIILDEIVKIKKNSNISILNHDIKILKNIPTVLSLIPSIIDYTINIGLKETSIQWINFLNSNVSFSLDVLLKSLITSENHLCF